jgi:hypothetical protein
MRRETIDRAVFEKLRLEMVKLQLLPDATKFSTVQEFDNEKNVLRELLLDKQLVDVVGVGSAYLRGEKTSCRIVIDRKKESEGSVNCYGVMDYEKYVDTNGDLKYRKMSYPNSTKTIEYEVRFIATSVQKERLLMAAFDKALGTYIVLKCINDDGAELQDEFELKRTNLVNVSSVDNVIEWLYTYNVLDVWLEDKTKVSENISPLKSIIIEVDMLTNNKVDLNLL